MKRVGSEMAGKKHVISEIDQEDKMRFVSALLADLICDACITVAVFAVCLAVDRLCNTEEEDVVKG